MAEKKTLQIIEDVKNIREEIKEDLTDFGFNCLAGETLSQSFMWLHEYHQNTSVLILDMNLTEFKDYQKFSQKKPGEAVTGITLAKDVYSTNSDDSPEIIILTAHQQSSYYQQAIDAGITAYLLKGSKHSYKRLIPLIRVLAFKYAFKLNERNNFTISNLAETSVSLFEILNLFVNRKLISELDLCFTAESYILLCRFKNSGESQQDNICIYSKIPELPRQEEFDYLKLHEYIIREHRRKQEKIQITEENSESIEARKTPGIFSNLTFTLLATTSNLEISIGFLNSFPQNPKSTYNFSTESLCEILIDYVSSSLEIFIKALVSRWQTKMEIKLKQIETATKLSSAIHNNLNAILPGGRSLATVEELSALTDELKQFLDGLYDYSKDLHSILENKRSDNQPIIYKRLSEVVYELNVFNQEIFCLENDCLISVDEHYFKLALSAMIKWFRNLQIVNESQKQLLIHISWTINGIWLEINFQEKNSRRLSDHTIKSELEEPFSSLNMAKLIIEVACQGILLDASSELNSEFGYLFKIKILNN